MRTIVKSFADITPGDEEVIKRCMAATKWSEKDIIEYLMIGYLDIHGLRRQYPEPKDENMKSAGTDQ